MAAEKFWSLWAQIRSFSVEDKEDSILDGVNSVQDEQEEVMETEWSKKIQGVSQTQKSATKMSRMTFKIKPPASISKAKADATYVLKSNHKKWSSITNIEKKIQEEVVGYSLHGQSLSIKKKIQVGIGKDCEDNLAEAAGNYIGIQSWQFVYWKQLNCLKTMRYLSL